MPIILAPQFHIRMQVGVPSNRIMPIAHSKRWTTHVRWPSIDATVTIFLIKVMNCSFSFYPIFIFIIKYMHKSMKILNIEAHRMYPGCPSRNLLFFGQRPPPYHTQTHRRRRKGRTKGIREAKILVATMLECLFSDNRRSK